MCACAHGATNYMEHDVTVTAPTPITITLRPNGGGSTTQLSNNDNNWPYMADWECVDEVTADGTTTCVEQGSGTAFDTYSIENTAISSGTITKVTVHIVISKTSSATGYAGAAIRIGGSNYFGSTKTATNNWVNESSEWLVNPNGGAAWTWQTSIH